MKAPGNLATQTGAYPALISAANELRRKVFIDEQGVPAEEVLDEIDCEDVHVVIFDGDAPVATAKVAALGGGRYRIGLVAVDATKRGQQLGKMVMLTALEYVSSQGGTEVLVASQQQAVGFYEKFGFKQNGKAEHLESGFVLVPMRYVNKQL